MDSRWPRVEIHHGRGVCFDVIFLRHKARRCNSHVKIPAGTPEPVSMRWGPDSDAARWFAPTTEAAFATSQGNEEPETAPASEESSEDSSSESSTANATNEDDSDNRPAIADSEREARRLRATRRWARIQTQAAMRQMGRYDQAQNERRNQADMRESFARVFSRGLLRQL